jgi:hypothetical protein
MKKKKKKNKKSNLKANHVFVQEQSEIENLKQILFQLRNEKRKRKHF